MGVSSLLVLLDLCVTFGFGLRVWCCIVLDVLLVVLLWVLICGWLVLTVLVVGYGALICWFCRFGVAFSSVAFLVRLCCIVVYLYFGLVQ